MNAPSVSGSDLDLVFTWDKPQRRKRALMGFLLASLMLHALCFYAFQIIYPPAVALLPPPARVTVIAPNSDEERILLRWLEAEDPALASTTQPLDEKKSLSIPTIQHAPSYLMRQPALKEAPPLPPKPGIPSAQPPGPIEPLPAPIQTAAPISATAMRFSPELDLLGAPQRPEMKFTASGNESPQVAQFRLAVNENGEVRHCFLENSSGDAALDEQARKDLVLCRFAAIPNPKSAGPEGLVWGTATIEWGSDIVAPSAAERVAP